MGLSKGDLIPNVGACPYFEASCRLGLADGCWDLVGSRETKLCSPTESLSTREALELACRGEHAKACVTLGRSLVMQGNRVTAKDAERAARYFERACNPAEASGCASLSIAYAEGRGKPRDQARARYFRRLACALANDQQSCVTLPGG